MDPIVERELAADRARPSAGALLRAARERQGMHVATLAAAIKVSTHKIEALEEDRWDELPGPTFTRALAQAVCRVLKTDPRPVLVLLPPADTSMLDSTVGSLNEPFAGRLGGEAGGPGFQRPGLIVWAALALLLAALALWFAPKGWFTRLTGQGPATARADSAGAASAVRVPAARTPSPSPAQIAVPAFPAAPVAPAASGPAGGPVATPAAAGAAAVPPATTALNQAAAPAPGASGGSGGAAAVAPAVFAGALVLRSSAASWVEVRDAAGRTLVSRTLLPGEPIAVDGAAPLQVVVGNAGATEVIYKGRQVVLSPVGRDNVARVELR
jgi:cytoskeleton protein RodZ